MNWDDLRIFLSLCREGSVSRAGRVLGVNHTTVARRIGVLEGALRVRLFDRGADGYAMTQAAEEMYGNVLQMEECALAIDREIAGRDAELTGKLRATAPYDFANVVIMPRLAKFKEAYPLIDLELLTTAGLVDLAAREADIAVRLTNKPPDYLMGREVLPLRHGVYGARRTIAKIGKSDPGVVLFRSGEDRPEWVRQHFPDATTVLRADNVTTILAAVRAGMGLARVPCFIGDSDPNIRRLDLDLTPSTWGVWILSHVDLRATARVRVAREFLTGVVESRRSLILGEDSKYA